MDCKEDRSEPYPSNAPTPARRCTAGVGINRAVVDGSARTEELIVSALK
jgi:hypothetical protein